MASATTSAAAAAAVDKKILVDLSPVINIYTDGTVHRIMSNPHVPPSSDQPENGVFSKDITAAVVPPARVYLPKPTTPTQKFPILIYYHGGGFLIGSAYSSLEHRYLNILASESKALIISVEYRLAPEHPLPAGYDDSSAALKWVCSHDPNTRPEFEKDPWITTHGDFSKIFIAGDSAGANIAHNIAMRVGSDPLPGNLKISGAILSHPYFWGSDPIGNEPKEDIENHMCRRIWVSAAYPNAENGIDNPMINPIVNGAPSLSGLGCERILVCVSEKDVLTCRAKAYVEEVKKSEWRGAVELVEIEGEDHCFHVFDPECEKAKVLLKKMASFITSH